MSTPLEVELSTSKNYHRNYRHSANGRYLQGRKNLINFFCARLLTGLTLALVGLGFLHTVNAGTLSCSVATTCPSGTVIWRMSGTANAHAELPSQSNYTQLVCCSGVTGLGNSCSGTFATALKLSATTNAHSEQNSQSNYANNACIQAPSGGSVSVGYQATNCTGFDTTLGSMTGTTNAHVGDGTAYTTKICGTAAGAEASLTFVVTTNNFATLSPGSPVKATSTLNVNTNNASGWNVTLSGNNVTATAKAMNDGAGTEITDLTPQWIIPSGAATTTAGNATAITNGQDVLAFRVMSASSTNGAAFLSTAWWGTSDAMFNASQLWAGIASSTNVSRIGNAGTGSLSASDHLNTVQYYLDVPATQKTGTYTGTLTYTATANP
ncbi:MAG: hypothetical protein HYV67_03550 [Candidatus Taylorbacteria bacterium]|nr:hypothetical protein [Candidatus Taylorbacteria bacterium]